MTPEAGAVCVECGLCCDGTLFATAALTADEAARPRLKSLPVVTRDDGSTHLSQPCDALHGTRCTVYDDRPAACRAYDCDLLNALRGWELTKDEALALVREVRARARDVLQRLPTVEPEAPRLPLRQRVRAAHRPHLGEPLPAELWQAFHALDEALDHSFRGRRGR